MNLPDRYKERVENLHKDLLRYGTILMDNQLGVQGFHLRIRLIVHDGKAWLDTMTNGELTELRRVDLTSASQDTQGHTHIKNTQKEVVQDDWF